MGDAEVTRVVCVSEGTGSGVNASLIECSAALILARFFALLDDAATTVVDVTVGAGGRVEPAALTVRLIVASTVFCSGVLVTTLVDFTIFGFVVDVDVVKMEVVEVEVLLVLELGVHSSPPSLVVAPVSV